MWPAPTPDLATLGRETGLTWGWLGGPSSQVSVREEGAGFPEAQTLWPAGLICSSSSATNLHGLPSRNLCLLAHKTGLTVAPHRIVVRAGQDGTRAAMLLLAISPPSPHPSWVWGQGICQS